MKFIIPFLFFVSACSDVLVEDPNNGDPKGNVDYCEAFGWYNDGRCDKDCAKPDPDCKTGIPDCETNPTQFTQKDNACESESFRCDVGTQYYEDACGKCGCVGEAKTCALNPNVAYYDLDPICAEGDDGLVRCEDGQYHYQDECGCGCIDAQMCELNPSVDYVAFGDDCQNIDFTCEEESLYVADECGCGCLYTQSQCTYDDPDVEWFSADPEVCSQENIRRDCPFDTFYFENDCGCGCSPVSNCNSDRDCPDGFCDRQLEESVCVFNRCGDGSQILCDALPPRCPAGQVASEENGCWGPCVSARTCQFVCENDDDCASQNLGPVCVVPDCLAVEGAVCENFCAGNAG